jgi:hypothetical protein
MGLQVKQVVEVTREQVRSEQTRVLGVRGDHDVADGSVVGALRAADEQRAGLPGRRGGVAF